MLSSLADDTPEGKSIIELGREQGIRMHTLQTETKGAHIIPFTAETKCSGVDLKDGTQIRKGAFDAIRSLTQAAGHDFPRKRKMLFKHIRQRRYSFGGLCQSESSRCH